MTLTYDGHGPRAVHGAERRGIDIRRIFSIAGAVLLMLAVVPSADAAGAGMRYVKKTVSIQPHGSHGTEVVCPEGTVVVGGGVTASSPKVVMLESMTGSSSSTTWAGAAANPTGAKQTLTVIADCVKVTHLPTGAVVTPRTQSFGVPASGGGGIFQTCTTAGDLVTGGGFAAGTTDPGFHVEYTGPRDTFNDPDDLPNDSWEVGYSNGSTATVTFTVETICISPTVPLVYKENSVNAAPDTNTRITAKCDSGSQVTGGGATENTLDTTTILRSTKPTGLSATPPGTGWAEVVNAGDSLHVFNGVAICLPRNY